MKRSLRCVVSVVALLVLLTLPPSPVHAETDPRDYEAILYLPTNTSVLVAYYRHESSEDHNESLTQNLAIFRGIWTLKVGDFSLAPVDILLPVADVSLTINNGAGGTLGASGIGDLEFLPTAVYSLKHDKLNYTYFGFTPYFFFPTGNFDGTHPINIGSNRFAFEPEIMIGQRYQMFDLELVGNLTVFGDSNDHIVPAGDATVNATLKQDATYALAVHLSMDLSPLLYVAASYYVANNGRTHFVGTGFDTEASPSQTVHTARFSWGIRLEKASLLLLQYNQDFHVTGGASITRFFGARISTLF